MSNPRHPYVGMWVTEDGYIRHELLPNAGTTKRVSGPLPG